MSTTRPPFESECFYHVYNHARGSDNLFSTDWDYKTFLELVRKFITPVATIYAYCLMLNHFHFLVRNREIQIPSGFKRKDENSYFSHQWGSVQNTFSKKKNYRSGKRGGLFCQSINRTLIDSEQHLQMCMVYIHNNPVKHGFTNSPGEWRFSSYKAIISQEKTDIARESVLRWFESKENFKAYHESNADELFVEKYKLR